MLVLLRLELEHEQKPLLCRRPPWKCKTTRSTSNNKLLFKFTKGKSFNILMRYFTAFPGYRKI